MSAGTETRKPRNRKATTANPVAGEHEITLAGTTYLLRPSMRANIAIETMLETSLYDLLRRSDRGLLTLEEIGAILREYIIAGATDELTKTVSAERLAELAYEEGLGKSVVAITLILADVISGGRDAAGNVKGA